MITSNLSAIQVVLPLLAAPVCSLLRFRGSAWLFTTVVCAASFLVSIQLLMQVNTSGPISYHMGGWAPPWGIEYYVDQLSAFVLMLISGIGTIVMLYARQSVNAEINRSQHALFYTSFLLCLAGLLGMTITGDAFNLFVFLEISSLSSYVLISLGGRQDRRAYTAAFTYLITGTIGATFIVIGIGLLYMITGTLNMADLSERLVDLSDNRTIRVAYAFVIIGISVKLALFPLHIWLPNAYSFAPSVVTIFLASTATKVALYVFLRFNFNVFSMDQAFTSLTMEMIVLPISVIAMFSASIVAVFQDDVKRVLAYSSVAQVGYMTLGISLGSLAGVSAGILHLFNHALIKGGLFMALGCFALRVGGTRLSKLRGLGREMPLTMSAFVLGGLSLIGVPLTAGFISKWALIMAVMGRDWWWVAAAILISSLIAVVYVWRVVETIYIAERPTGAAPVREAPLSMLAPMWFMVFANLYFGISTDFSLGLAKSAAESLLGAGLGTGP